MSTTAYVSMATLVEFILECPSDITWDYLKGFCDANGLYESALDSGSLADEVEMMTRLNIAANMVRHFNNLFLQQKGQQNA